MNVFKFFMSVLFAVGIMLAVGLLHIMVVELVKSLGYIALVYVIGFIVLTIIIYRKLKDYDI